MACPSALGFADKGLPRAAFSRLPSLPVRNLRPSQSIMAFGALWGLVTCHSYGAHGMRVSFPVRQMLRLLSQSISRNIERLSYAQRLTTRKLVNESRLYLEWIIWDY